MQTVSDLFKSKIKEASREFECKITIGDRVFTNEDLVDIKLSNGLQSEGFMIGATPSAMLDLTLLNRGDIIYSTNQIKIEIGLNIGSKFEYLLMGKFNIDEVEKTDYTVKFTAYDNMIKFETAYFSALGDNPTLQQVVNELASKTGVQFTGTLPTCNVKKLEGFTCREVLGYVASLCGGNAFITRDGKFTIVVPKESNYSITTDNYFDYKREEVIYKVGKVSCQVGEEIISKGTLGIDNMELQFENPWITPTILTDIYNKLKTFNYLGYNMKWQGDISLDLGDIVTVTDIKGVSRKVPILNMKFTYTGGLTSEIEAKGETKNKNSFSSSGSNSNKINRLVTEQAVIKEALIEKANIEDLKATNAEIANLKVKDTEIENALIKKATIEQLNATNANIQNLIAEDARINNLVASKASITELNAVSAKIGTVEADTAIIKDLLAGNVTAGSGQIIHLTAKNVTIEDAVIKNLIAAKLSVADLQAGTINTNKFTIASTDGGLNIVGPTMQFKDKNNKVRIQMGQDAQGDFNFILRGADGTTTLIDHTGVKEKAIADDLIKSNMVAADAIGEKQINYSSLITGLNKDDNTQLIKASKVAIDLTGQSLEVAFNSLKSNVDNMEIGGRNLLLNSGEEITTESTDYLINRYETSGIKPNTKYTLVIKGKVAEGKKFGVWLNGPSNNVGYINAGTESTIGVLQFTSPSTITNQLVSLYHYPSSVEGVATIEWVAMYEGHIKAPTDWTPAPEDVDQVTQSLQTQITVAQGKIEGLIKDTTITEGSTSTSLKDAYISLKATVNGLNSTVASHTSSISTVTTELGKVDGKINSAKSDAISTAGADATSKSNKAKTDAIAAASSDATSKANNALNSAKSYTNAQITTVNTRVSNAESSINQLKDSITQKVWQTDIDKSITIANTIPDKRDTNELPSWYRKNYPKQIIKEFKRRNAIGAPGGVTYGILETIIPWSDKSGGIIIQVFSSIDGTYERRGYTDDTAWNSWRTIEDTEGSQNKIDNFNTSIVQPIKTEVTTVKEKAATLETNLNGITSKVTNLESTTSTIDGKVNAQETRLQSTEQKVTATGVITTITEAINAGTNSLTTMQFILDKNGATINNGKFISKDDNGKKKYELDGQALKLYDYTVTTDRVAGAIESRHMIADSNVVGMSIICRDNKWISIDYVSSGNDDITQENSSPFARFWNPNDLYKRQIEFFKRIHLNGNSISFSQQSGGYDSYFKAIGYQLLTYLPNPSTTINREYASWIIANNATGEDHIVLMPKQMEIYPYIWNQGGIYTAGSISSAKIATQDVKTSSYGTRSLNSYQTADALVSDFGEGTINEDGECIVFLDEVFKELVNTNCTYRVILTPYDENDEFESIDLKCIKKTSEYFTVKSKCIGLKFDWSVVAKEKDEEMTRLRDTKLTRDLSLDVKVSDLLNADDSIKSKDAAKQLTEQSYINLEINNKEDIFLKELEINNEDILSEIEGMV